MSITLVTQETIHHKLAARALSNTLAQHDFDDVLVFSDQNFMPGARHVKVDHFPTVDDYCTFMLKGIAEHVTTDHILFVQWDAMAYDSTQWTDEFLKYDYIGAPWPWYPEGKNVGNGGFSLRSKWLLEACLSDRIKTNASDPDSVNEDQVIGVSQRAFLESACGITYAPTALAAQFSYELGPYRPSFGCHGPWNVVKLADLDTVDYYVHNIDYRGWNIHKWHHILYAAVDRGLYDHVPLLVDKLAEHSPDLLMMTLAWLRQEQQFWQSIPI